MKNSEYIDIFQEFPDEEERTRYLQARRRVKEIRGFYIHLLVYLGVNIFILVARLVKDKDMDWGDVNVPILWGIVILIHAGSVFIPNMIFGNDWEEKKIRELMNKYKNEME